MRGAWTVGLTLTLGCCLSQVGAQEIQWRAAPPRPAASAPAASPASGADLLSAVTLGAPVTLGRPVPIDSGTPPSPPVAPPRIDHRVTPVGFNPVTLTAPRPLVRGQSPEVPRPLPPGPPGSPQTVTSFTAGDPVLAPPGTSYSVGPGTPPGLDERYNNGVVVGGDGPPPPPPPGFEGLPPPEGFAPAPTRRWFQSDHCFDGFISPVTNPFLFEDPRSLTELRPIFIYQSTPGSNLVFRNGDLGFFGLQGRLALTERLSFVVHKFGWVWIQPESPQGAFQNEVGLSEIWLGAKYTFLRNEDSGTIAAGGINFQIPVGATKVFQDTGTFSMTPYFSVGQNFGRTSYGSFNAMGTVGYAFGMDQRRTDYLFTSFHLDYDIANLHKIYPLVELNWFHYTDAGGARSAGFEGRDLINFGSTGVSGNDSLSIAVGARYKFSEMAQMGVACEFPLLGNNDLLDFRLTVDFILRY